MSNIEILQMVKAGKITIEEATAQIEAGTAPAVTTIGPSGMAYCRVGKQAATFGKDGAEALIGQIQAAVKAWDKLPLSKTAQLAKDNPTAYKAAKAKQLTDAAKKAAA